MYGRRTDSVGVAARDGGYRFLAPAEDLLGSPATASDQILEELAAVLRVHAAAATPATAPLHVVAHGRNLKPPNDQALRTDPQRSSLMIPETAAAGRVRCCAKLGACRGWQPGHFVVSIYRKQTYAELFD